MRPPGLGRLCPTELLRPRGYDALLVSQLPRSAASPTSEIEVGFPFEASGRSAPGWRLSLSAQLLDDGLFGR